MGNDSVGCVDGNGSSVKVIKGYRLNQNKKGGMNQGRKNSSFKSSSRIAFWSMLLLLVITFFISIKSNAQKIAYNDVHGTSAWQTHWLREDKALHVFSCMSLSMIGTATAYDWNWKNPEVFGIGLALGVGVAKEFFIDPTPDAYDLAANITGAILGVYIIKWSQDLEFKLCQKQKYKQKNRHGITSKPRH